MSREKQRQIVKTYREKIIQEIEELYASSFDQLSHLDIGDSYLAKLTQLVLTSKEAALKTLRRTIEDPIITKAPHQNNQSINNP